MNAFQKLKLCQKSKKSLLCVGLDTDLSKVPQFIPKDKSGIIKFNSAIIEATKDSASAYKINFAFYEQYGIEGMEALKETFELIPDDIFTIADAKRGDIGNTSMAYAKSCFDYFKADSITVNPYMGFDSVSPFLEYKEKMVFLLALTSNPGSADFQTKVLLADNASASSDASNKNTKLYQEVISKSLQWADHEKLGYVVGATHPDDLRDIRHSAPQNCFLIPGVGSQGGNIEAVMKANSQGPAIVNVSRDVIYNSTEKDFAQMAAKRAKFYKEALGFYEL